MSEPERYSLVPMAPYPPRRPRSKIVPWILGCSVLIFIIVAAAAIFVSWGWGLFTRQARTALSENPVIQTHIGEIREAHFNFWVSATEPDADVFAFDVIGTKGRGTAVAEFITVDGDTERIASGVLRLGNGKSYDLVATSTPGMR